mmetsp:Transcript_28071/g.89228  ORF Transcript_28071/g.89228 Transcript_28071/m.89228 type:complete len:383 (-) Transcript_28071:3-1151(-)
MPAWKRPVAGFLALVAGFLGRIQLDGKQPTLEYQAFIDHYPVTVFSRDIIHRNHFGPSKALAAPRLLQRFEWRYGSWAGPGDLEHLLRCEERRLGPDPSTVYTGPLAVERLLKIANDSFDSKRANRMLVVFAGNAMLLSDALSIAGPGPDERAVVVSRIRRFFSTVWFVGTDIIVDGVRTAPCGLSEQYLRPDGVVEDAVASIQSITADVRSKPGSVLWAMHTTEMRCDNATYEYWRKGFAIECDSKTSAVSWAATDAAREAGVEVRSISTPAVKDIDLWSAIAKYRFIITPLGKYIQTPKMIEALLLLTVPIVQRGPFSTHDELVHRGFPLVLVDAWAEVTAVKLGKWWQELALRLPSFRRNCLTADAYWRMLTGELDHCE